MASRKVDLSGFRKNIEEEEKKKKSYDFSNFGKVGKDSSTKNAPAIKVGASSLKSDAQKTTSKVPSLRTKTDAYRGNVDRDIAKQELYDRAKAKAQTYNGLSDNGKAMVDKYDSLSNADKKTISKYRQSGKGDGLKSIDGISLDNWRDMTKAMDYQDNVNAYKNRISRNDDYDKAINLDKKDKNYLRHLLDVGDDNTALEFLKASKNSQGWEEKYGMSYDQILNAFKNQMKNEEVDFGEAHPIISEIGTGIASIPRAVLGLNSTVANAIAPNSDYAEWAENARNAVSEQTGRYRTGVKENFGDKGDNVIDTVNMIADRALPTMAGSALGGAILGGVMGGASDTNQQMDILNQRPDMTDREKALSALGHGTVEGIGTGLTAGVLDLPILKGLGGEATETTAKSLLKNVGKNAFNAAFENSVSELIENGVDTSIGGENSQKAIDMQVALLNGATPKEAEEYAKQNQIDRVKMAAITGAGFGGATTALKGIVPALLTDNTPRVNTLFNGDISDVDAPKVDIAEPNRFPEYDGVPKIKQNLLDELSSQPKTVAELMAEAEANGINPTVPKQNIIDEANAQPKSISELMAEAQNIADEDIPIPGKAYSLEELANWNGEADADAQARIKKIDNTVRYNNRQIKSLREMLIGASDDGTKANIQKQIDDLEQNNKDIKAERTDLRKQIKERAKNVPEVKTETPVEETPEIATENPITNAEPSVPRVAPTEAETVSNMPRVQGEVDTDNAPTMRVNPDVPKGINPEADGNDISRSYETFKNSDLFARSEENMKALENAKEAGMFNKEVETRLKAQDDALNEYVANKEEVKARNLKDEWTSGKDLDTGMLVLKDALESGDQADINITLLKQANQRTKAGRILRAARDYAGTKEGTLAKATSFMADKAEEFLSKKKNATLVDSIAKKVMEGDFNGISDFDDVALTNIKNALAKGADLDDIKLMIGMYKTVGKTGVSAEAIDEINNLFGEIEKLPAGSRARANLETDAYKILANDIGGKRSFGEMWDSWRYLAMLGNPRTHIRNIIGNTTHYMVTNIKDGLGALIEDAVDKTNRAFGGEGIERTKAILRGEDDALVQAGRADADNVVYARLNDSNKYTDVKSEIARARSAFNGNQPLNKIEEFNSNMLDLEDYNALKKKYSRALAGYLKANGADESIFEATDDVSANLLENARNYAIDQAKQATFHEYSALADTLTQASNNLRKNGGVGKIGSHIIEGLIPFKKTPINIIKQAYKYSPLNVLSIVSDITKSAKPAKVIEDVASTLTGTGIVALGAFLGSQGLLSGNQNSDYNVDNAESEQGAQNYAITIGNKSYTLDWAAPFSLPLFVGVELQKALENGGIEGDEVLGALSSIAEPVTEMSMLQGIQDVLTQLSYGTGSALATFGANTLTGYITQGVPTLGGQVARSIDNTRMSTYSDKASGLPKQLDRALIKAENKVPFLNQTNQPYVDYKGNVEKSQGIFSSMMGDNFGTRLLDNMVSPGYYKEGNVTDTDRELNRVYEATGEQIYPVVSDGKVGNKKLSKEDFTKYQTLYGQNTSKFYDALIQSDGYASLDDSQKATMLKDIRNFAKNIADFEVGGKTMNTDFDKAYELYKQNGIDGVAQYYNDKIKASALDMTYNSYIEKEAGYKGGAEQYAIDKKNADKLGLTVSTYNKKQLEYQGGAKQYAQDKLDAVKYGYVQSDGDPNVDAYKKALDLAGGDVKLLEEANSMGLGKKATNAYYSARNKIPSLTTDMYSNLYDEVNGDGKDGITQKEFKAYLNGYNATEEEAMLLYQIFGGEWTTSPYVTKKGTWSLK